MIISLYQLPNITWIFTRYKSWFDQIDIKLKTRQVLPFCPKYSIILFRTRFVKTGNIVATCELWCTFFRDFLILNCWVFSFSCYVQSKVQYGYLNYFLEKGFLRLFFSSVITDAYIPLLVLLSSFFLSRAFYHIQVFCMITDAYIPLFSGRGHCRYRNHIIISYCKLGIQRSIFCLSLHFPW